MDEEPQSEMPEDPDEIDPYPLTGEEGGDDEDECDSEREETGESVTIEIAGLSLYTHHGVSEAEREVGQRLVLDLRLDVGGSDADVPHPVADTGGLHGGCALRD